MYGKILLSLSILAVANSACATSCNTNKGVVSIWAAPVVRYQTSKAKEIKGSSSIANGKIANITLNGSDSDVEFKQKKNLGYFAGRAGLSIAYKAWNSAAIGWEVFGDFGSREAWLNDIDKDAIKPGTSATSGETDGSGARTNDSGAQVTPIAKPDASSAGADNIVNPSNNYLNLKHNVALNTGLFVSYYMMENMRLNGGIGGIMHATKYEYGGTGLDTVKSDMKYSFGGYLKVGFDYLFAKMFFVGAEVSGQLRANKDVKLAQIKTEAGGTAGDLEFKTKGAFGFNGALRLGLDLFKF